MVKTYNCYNLMRVVDQKPDNHLEWPYICPTIHQPTYITKQLAVVWPCSLVHTHPNSLWTSFIVGRDTWRFDHFSSSNDLAHLAVNLLFSDNPWLSMAIISPVNFLGLVLRGRSNSLPVSLYFFTRLKRACKLMEIFSSLKRFLLSKSEWLASFNKSTLLLVDTSKCAI